MENVRGYAAIGLYHPKTDINVGSVLRAAGCYEAALVAIEGNRCEGYIKKYQGGAPTDPQNNHKHLPLIHTEDLHSVIPYNCVPVAVDLIEDAKSLVDYVHPERAFYIFGPEDGTLGKKVTDYCQDRIYVPTNSCMNLAATVNVVLYDRLAKSQNRCGNVSAEQMALNELTALRLSVKRIAEKLGVDDSLIVEDSNFEKRLRDPSQRGWNFLAAKIINRIKETAL